MKPGSPPIAAIILAAGMSARMGKCKSLLDIGGKSVIQHVLDNLDAPGISRRVIVTGHFMELICSAVRGETCIHNAQYAAGGMISSIKIGLAAVAEKCDGVLIVLGDHPLVGTGTFEQIVGQGILHPNKIIQPRYDGKSGHPVLIPGAGIESILALPAEATLKTWMRDRAEQILALEVNDPGILMDVDTPEDYQRAVAMFESARAATLTV